MTGQKTVPNVFIRGQHIGGSDAVHKLHQEGQLISRISPPSENYEYDMVVIGGGSGGLACSKVCGYISSNLSGHHYMLISFLHIFLGVKNVYFEL